MIASMNDQIRVHLPGTPDVPDIIHPGDWITDDEHETFMMVVKVKKNKEGKWDACPGAESWTIYILGIGYMTGEAVGMKDCGFINNIVAVDGKLLPLQKCWDKHQHEIKLAKKPDYVTVSKSAKALVMRSAQMSFI